MIRMELVTHLDENLEWPDITLLLVVLISLPPIIVPH